jgi:hypothetical protein
MQEESNPLHQDCPWMKKELFVLAALERIEQAIKDTRIEIKDEVGEIRKKVEGLEGFKNRIAAIGGFIAFITSAAVSIVAGLLGKSNS